MDLRFFLTLFVRTISKRFDRVHNPKDTYQVEDFCVNLMPGPYWAVYRSDWQRRILQGQSASADAVQDMRKIRTVLGIEAYALFNDLAQLIAVRS
jgi:hypothetical protein